MWQLHQRQYLDWVVEEGRSLKLGDDARCSPIHIAKYGSYSLMDLERFHIDDNQGVDILYPVIIIYFCRPKISNYALTCSNCEFKILGINSWFFFKSSQICSSLLINVDMESSVIDRVRG